MIISGAAKAKPTRKPASEKKTGSEVAHSLYEFLYARKILVRLLSSSPLTAVFIRISIGDEKTDGNSFRNNRFMAEKRIAEIQRETKETQISLKLNLDGEGISTLETGVPFFNHMLELFTRHGLFDLEIKAQGDLDVDYHHVVEDIGIVLGQAVKEAVGGKLGINRYGFFLLPMDETLASVILDLGGRSPILIRMNPAVNGLELNRRTRIFRA